MHRTYHAWPVLALHLVCAAVLADPAAAQSGRVYGRVFDAETGQTIRGATIVAENQQSSPNSFTSVSDDKGRFAMIGLRSGMWILTSAAPGYYPLRGSVRVQTLGNNPPAEFRLVKIPELPPLPLAGIDSKVLGEELIALEQHFSEGRLDEAIAASQALLTRVPVLTSLHLQIGRAYRLKKDFASAIAEYAKVPESDPQYAAARVEQGEAELERGNLEAAESVLTEAAESATAGPEAFYALGEVKLAGTRPVEAAAWFEKASQADPAWPSPYVKLGMVALDRGDRETAVAFLEKALALDPEAADVRALLERAKR